MPNWLGFALDAAEWILKHPLPAGAEPTFNSKISSLGKKRIYYSNADLYELLELNVEFDIDAKEGTCVLERSGLGAKTTVRIFTNENTSLSLQWGSSYYQLRSTDNAYTSSDGQAGTVGVTFKMEAQTVNSLPTVSTTSTSMLPIGSYQVTGTVQYPSSFAENTFFTNNSGYVANHTLLTKNTFNICQVVSPIYSGTTINTTNINDFRKYGYDIDINNNVTLDNDVLLAYIQNELLPQLELQYRNTYVDFPEPDANYGDDDITYINPFEDDEEPTEPSYDIQPFSIDYNEILSEKELESILAESRYILDTTPYEIASIDYNQAVSEPYAILKQNSQLPAEVAGSISKVYSIAEDVIPADIMKVYGFIAFLSVGMWFILRK